ncbi:zinc finger AN1 and C2H2 domain-containing stress-associated protein 16 [Physcomitrium patens]|uniref:AN1-type domain-containing protein n=2 Tax=Physcomitrium patens TaxID=3218 RepID=A0A2K1K8Q4_PHYPA|nr:zinc finger AN1 and C2H2 domain-containing stress-associated protein 16-like [Physcomitrium patens]PNR50156.1 hypothetical protein PHYPA_012053 [Physcomitrium patens]|eukprot:XP_024381979.1 zinc finger AN1 and C2H2 domain-containing stress-associated protein 16-like [Physcomitrella patens]
MEFPDLGLHCSEETCHQLDFLPFKCDGCRKDFCLEHRAYKAHSCANANHKDVSVQICPVCAMSVKTVFGETVGLTMKKHQQSKTCDPRNYVKVTKKPKCPVRGCRELLTFSNKYCCNSCQKTVCLRHRFPSDHACGIAPTRATAQIAAGSKFLASFASRHSDMHCGAESNRMASLYISEKRIDQEKTPTVKP